MTIVVCGDNFEILRDSKMLSESPKRSSEYTQESFAIKYMKLHSIYLDKQGVALMLSIKIK